MPTISYSIGGEKHDISGKSGKEVVAMVVKEIKKKKFIVRNKQEEEKICSLCEGIIGGDDDDINCNCGNEGEEEEEEGHHIVYGEFLEYDDDGVCSGTYNDGFAEIKTYEEALLEYNRMIKNNGDKEYDMIYLDYVEGEGAEADQDNVEFWEKPLEESCIKCGTTDKLRDYHLSAVFGSTGIVKTCYPCGRNMTTEKCVYDVNGKPIQTIKDFKKEFGELLKKQQCRDCEIEAKKHCDECGGYGSEGEEDVCCVGCNERVCSFNEEPPHKDSRDEAVCDECIKL